MALNNCPILPSSGPSSCHWAGALDASPAIDWSHCILDFEEDAIDEPVRSLADGPCKQGHSRPSRSP